MTKTPNNINIYMNIENDKDCIIVDDSNKIMYLDSVEEALEVKAKIYAEWERLKSIN